jgi:hypothetical protein
MRVSYDLKKTNYYYMKKVIKYMSALLLLFVAITGCQDFKDWTIVTDVQPGTYIAGDATVYSSIAPSAAFTAAAVDGDAEQFPGMLSKYTWLKTGGQFTVVIADADGNITHYGKGSGVSEQTTALTADAAGYTVPETGLYFLVLNSNQKQLTILPVRWGIIGSATEGGWDSETVFPEVEFVEATSKVTYTGSFIMSKAEMKFRFNQTWGVSVPYDGSTNVTIHTNIGATGAGVSLTTASVELKSGGDNLAVANAANYDVTMTFDLRSSKFTGSAIMGEPIATTYPERLYMVGDAYRGWPGEWLDVANELVPVNGMEGHFWTVVYLKSGGFKFSPKLAWDGDFGITETNTDAIGEYTKGGNNINVATEGYYQIYVNLVDEKISITAPQVILKGDAATGGWDSGMATDAFTVDNQNKILTSPTFAKDAELRICVVLPDIDWWRSEFIVLAGKIVYRGNGGDQERVGVTAGGRVTLNFDAGTGQVN